MLWRSGLIEPGSAEQGLAEPEKKNRGTNVRGEVPKFFSESVGGRPGAAEPVSAKPETKVLRIVEKMLEIGVDEISIADTVGYANPRDVSSLIKKVIKLAQSVPLIGHFHDTRGFGLANLVAAVDEGVKKFDSSLRGLGGCPYAPGASGNIATEDCANLLQL